MRIDTGWSGVLVASGEVHHGNPTASWSGQGEDRSYEAAVRRRESPTVSGISCPSCARFKRIKMSSSDIVADKSLPPIYGVEKLCMLVFAAGSHSTVWLVTYH